MDNYRLAWATDIHLEFCDEAGIDAFVQAVKVAAPDGLVLTGDIGQAPSVARFLKVLERGTSCPIYFVLGNHDFYKGSIAAVRAELQDTPNADRLRWLRTSDAISLTARTALVGVDGWADGRFGDYANSDVMLNDFILIRELSGISAEERLARMQRMADEDAGTLDRQLRSALPAHERVIVATHVPPFAAAAWHEGRQSDDNWLPHFSCKAVGDVLLASAERHQDREILVLCGHTHGGGTILPLPNLRVITGPAEYGAPGLQAVFDLV
jgi:Icc protein